MLPNVLPNKKFLQHYKKQLNLFPMNLVIGIEDIPTYFKYVTDKRGSPDPSL